MRLIEARSAVDFSVLLIWSEYGARYGRREEERCQKIEAARLYKLHYELREAIARALNEPATPYAPTEDDFVLANEEIETYIRREDRKTAARQAEIRRSASG